MWPHSYIYFFIKKYLLDLWAVGYPVCMYPVVEFLIFNLYMYVMCSVYCERDAFTFVYVKPFDKHDL